MRVSSEPCEPVRTRVPDWTRSEMSEVEARTQPEVTGPETMPAAEGPATAAADVLETEAMDACETEATEA